MQGEMASLLPGDSGDRRHRRMRKLSMWLVGLGIVAAPLLFIVGLLTTREVVTTHRDHSTAIESNHGPPATPMYTLNADGVPTSNLLSECEEKFFTQTLDHFDVGAPTYEERYFVCDKNYREGGVMFFYVGNEADVELYLNHTGLMWENAAEFGAMLVFAEHRYFGKSLPFGNMEEAAKHMTYLSIEQALADYAMLITYLKEQYERDIPVVGFGGSYGGMLGSWFRMKYPQIVDGVIAASAPILQYLGDELPPDIGSYARLVTFDASPDAGASDNCVPNVRRTWPTLRALGKTESGRRQIREAFTLCDNTMLDSEEDVETLIAWAKGSFDYMAMGNYPYPSSYIMNGKSVLPAYPMRVACSHLQEDQQLGDEFVLLQSFSKAIGVYYNSTQEQQCYQLGASSTESAVDANFWDYLFCTQSYGPLSSDGVLDMFWDVPWNYTADNASCHTEWGVDANRLWPTIQFGGRKAVAAASNLVFSNGDYDPCSGTGVLETVSDSVVAVRIPGAAHHLDLMFSNPLDPEPLKAARAIEKQHMWTWVGEFYEHKATLLGHQAQ